ncbi:MAG: carboxypeptidase regulatory-like domain-containing protein [Bryobacterales bacterium]|nr:carboxypeptidase regulatory-like domain-containing protein [Bryobacterales bacterium]
MFQKYARIALFAVFALAVWGWSVLGQGLSGSIAGVVFDSGGAVVPGVKVTLSNEGTGFTREASTNAQGQYVAYSLTPGPYRITVEQPGFQKLIRSGVTLAAADALTVDLTLSVGDVQQTIEVTESSPLLQAQTAMVSSLVSNDQIIEIPLQSRTFTALLLLSPGATPGSSGNLTTSPYAMRGNANISVNGSSAQNNAYFIDGMINRNLWLNTLIMVPTVDSIQEMRVLTSNYSAEYGISAGAITVVQTKSGTNRLRGSLYEFVRNDKFDANDFFNNRAGVARPALRRNEFGGTVGGPIRKDRTFIFGDYQGIRIRRPLGTISTIPTLSQRNMLATGDFGALGATVFDPANTVTGANNARQRVAFAGNRIPVSRLDPASRAVFGLLPDPINADATRNFAFNPNVKQRTDQFDVKLDQNLGDADRFFFKYSFDDTDLETPGLLPVGNASGVPIGEFLSSGGAGVGTTTPLRNQSGVLNHVKVFSPTLLNEARVGIVRWNQNINPLNNEFNTSDAIGIPGININDKSGGLPGMNIAGFQTLGDASTYPETSQMTSFQFEDVLTWTTGNHTLKVGGIFVRHRFNGFSAFPTRGTFTFNGQFTRQIGTSTAATSLADYALGAYNSLNRNILVGTFGMRFWNSGAFIDDTWRVNNRLTWNIGLRHDIQAPPHEVYDRWSNFNIDTARLEVASGSGASRRLRNLDLNNFAPRTGLTYMLTEDRKTVFRSGFGVSYVEAGQGGGQLYKNLPFFFAQVLATDQNAAPPFRLSEGLPTPVAPDPNDINAISGGSPNAWDYDLQSTRVMQWSAGVQRELVKDLLVDVSYVGTRTNGLLANININQSVPGPGAQNPRRPFFALNPNLINLSYRTNYGSAKYHGLQVRVERRMTSGLSASLAYTYAKYMANAGNANGGGNGPPQDARCTACEWGNTPEDRRNILVFNHVWELPFGKSRKYLTTGPASWIFGNWNLSGVWTASSGERFTATLAGAVSNSAGGGGDRPNRIADGNLPEGERTIDRWFDTTAFAAGPQFTFGNSARGILIGPGNLTANINVQRDFLIGERFRTQFRWEMYNAFNRVNFGNPNAAIGNPLVGQISGAAEARSMQLALKFYF